MTFGWVITEGTHSAGVIGDYFRLDLNFGIIGKLYCD